MGSAADQLLEKALDDAISATNNPVAEGVCAHHDSLRLGLNVLLRCQKASGYQNGTSEVSLFGGRLLSIKGTKITGRDVVLIVLLVSMLAFFTWTISERDSQSIKLFNAHREPSSVAGDSK